MDCSFTEPVDHDAAEENTECYLSSSCCLTNISALINPERKRRRSGAVLLCYCRDRKEGVVYVGDESVAILIEGASISSLAKATSLSDRDAELA